MDFRPEHVRAFLKALATDPEAREDFARLVLPHELRELAEAQRRTAEQVGTLAASMDGLAEAQRRTEERLEALTARVDALTARVDSLAQQMEALTARVDALTARVDSLAQQMEALTARVDALTARVDALTARVDSLAQQMEALTARVDALAEAQRRTEERLEALTARVDALTARVDSLAQQMEALTARVDALAEAQRRTEERLDRLADQVGEVRGRLSEIEYWLRPGRFTGIARGPRPLSPEDRDAILRQAVRDGQLTVEETDEVYRADLVLAARRPADDADILLVVEVSATVDSEDVRRAARRAEVLRRTGREVWAVVAGGRVTVAAEEAARRLGVWQLTDGRAVEPAA